MQEHFQNNQVEKLKIVINGAAVIFTLPFLLKKKKRCNPNNVSCTEKKTDGEKIEK